MKPQRGFTIVELLIVIVVIGILAAITIVAFNGVQNKAKVSAAQSAATQAAKKVTVYAVSNSDQLPATLTAAGVADSAGTTYQYTPNTTVTPQNFCLTATNGGVAVHAAAGGPVTTGPCSGHSGTSPTTLADGSSCPAGYLVVPGSSIFGTDAFCVMKYEAKNVGGVATSQASGTPWVSISQTNAMTTSSAACDGCHLISEAEWLTIAHNALSVPSNWSGGAVGNGYIYSGHNDNSPANSLAAGSDSDGYSGTGNTTPSNQRRGLTLTNGEVIWDLAGNVWEWTSGQTSGDQPGASGYGWRQWNIIAGTGSLSPNPHPSYGTPAATNWTTSHGIGQSYSSSTETGLRGFRRGGDWNNGGNAGALTLGLDYSPSYTNSTVGFRVAR
ncbi:prepilin-type N-terminal cleavage/methylation domain-containing protein [Cryobacterium lyxosi]|uniref:prepilin-type N-terminal cleavage/methylation domain-containing protein n=1 Tax=Cryobacterium lyxosi TaxID=1259228 RepID=UPI002407EEA6|nr:prepilin-type N-terminal cleavage/methylation domain-containing protein [Cryobacterium lyxosi]